MTSDARTGQTVNPDLAREVEEALELQFGSLSASIVVTARIRRGALQLAMRLLGRRYDDRACREQVAFDRAGLERVDEVRPFQIVDIGTYDRLVIIWVGDGWDFCLTSMGRHVDAIILKWLLTSEEQGVCATAAVVASSGTIIA